MHARPAPQRHHRRVDLQPGRTDFEFRPGPLFVNILLVDEINRATPRTQAALLEAMQERQVTMDGVTYPLPSPFMVLATQNPVEYEGTFPLPEAQLDRFMLKIDMGYPDPEEEATILERLSRQHPIETLESVATPDEVDRIKPLVWEVHVDETVVDYLIRLVESDPQSPRLAVGRQPACFPGPLQGRPGAGSTEWQGSCPAG